MLITYWTCQSALVTIAENMGYPGSWYFNIKNDYEKIYESIWTAWTIFEKKNCLVAFGEGQKYMEKYG